MNNNPFIVYASLGILIVQVMQTNVVGESYDSDKRYVSIPLNLNSFKDNRVDIYSEVTQLTPKKDYRQRYAKIVKSNAFKQAYSGKSMGDFIKIED